MEDPLIATITVQNSKSVFRMQFNFEENSAVSKAQKSPVERNLMGYDRIYISHISDVLGIFIFLHEKTGDLPDVWTSPHRSSEIWL